MDLRYPIGKYQQEGPVSDKQRAEWIETIAATPALLRDAVAGLNDKQLDTPYRPEGWTVRQVVHHMGDSHLNSYVRYKWALTEEEPKIKAYYQDGWAMHPTPAALDMQNDLDFLEILHARWVHLLRYLSPDDWKRGLIHPETGGRMQLDWMLGLYAWHCVHHTRHITALREREGW